MGGKLLDALQRHGVGVALAGLALTLTDVLPFPEGAGIYQLPLVAVVLSAWYGGRGPGLLASLICAAGVWHWFVPPVHSWDISPEHVPAFSIFVVLCLLLTQFSGACRRAEHALRLSEKRFRTLVQFSFDVYWETDAQHRFTRQEFAERLTDAPPPNSQINKTHWEVPHLEPDEEGWRKHRARLDAHLPFRDFELARSTADGRKLYMTVSGMPVFDGSGRFVGYRGIGRDITERKRAVDEHRQHLRFLESMDRVNRAIQGTGNLEQMMNDVLDAVLSIFECDRAVLGRHRGRPDTTSFTLLAKRVRPGFALDLDPEVEIAADEDLRAMSAELKAGGGPVQWVLGSLPPGHARVLAAFGVQSVLSMPIEPKIEQHDSILVFTLRQCAYPRVWTPEEVRLFEEIGRRFGDAVTMLSVLRELRQSERRLEAAQRLARVGWWERDYTARQVALSEEACRIFGVQPVDLPRWQERWVSLIHPDDRQKTAEASEIALRGGPRYDVEYRVVRPDGTVRVVHSQGDVTWDESGRPVRQFGAMQDITELRQAERELRARQDMLDLAQEAARAVAFDWYIGARESENRWSPELEAMYGLEPGTFDGTYQGWKNLVHPDDWPAVKVALTRANESGDVAAEYRVIHKDGTVHWLRARGRMFFDAKNQLERMVGFMIDVTDRRQAEEELRASEERFRTFVDRATDAFFLLDEQLRVVDVNRQACESMGWSREEFIGMHPRQFAMGLDEPSAEQLSQRARPGEIITYETRHRRKDGTWFPVEIRTGTFKKGAELFYLGLVRDISERKLAEEALRAKDSALEMARTELAHVSRLTTLGELTASIAHEVNQPLGAMVTNAGACARWLAAEPPDMGEARAALGNIVADGKRASEIIGRIRALTKRQMPRMELLDVNRKVRQVVELAEDELRSRQIVLRTELDPTLPNVTGDRVQLQQVLLNLIVNATEAMSAIADRPRELTIITARSGASAVLVEVRDSGPGLAPEGVERVFEAFYTTKPEGIGIGLSISRSIVEAHGGRLWAGSNQPHGAVFRFSLPLAQEGAA